MEAYANSTVNDCGYTIEDWEKLPDYPRYELIDGSLFMTAEEGTDHVYISADLVRQLGNYLLGKRCRVGAEAGVRFRPYDKKTVARPDIHVVCDLNKIKKGYILGAPDMVIEILSPSTAHRDRFQKLNKYLYEGVREYWIVDPVHQTVEVYDWRNGSAPSIAYGRGDKVPVSVLDDCVIDLSTVFPDLERPDDTDG